MEITDFENGLVKYYGKHQSKHVTKVTMKYVHSNYNKDDYSSLMQAIMKSHPFNYGFPDVAAVEEAQDKLWKKDGKLLRKTKASTDWTEQYRPLTDDERKKAEPMRKDWKKLVGKISDKSQDKLSCIGCEYVGPDKKEEPCLSCDNYSNYEDPK